MPDPDHFQANLQRAELLLSANRAEEALPFAEAAIDANPDDPRGYVVLARSWNAVGDYQSLGAINQAIALEPGNSTYHGLKGWFLVCFEDYYNAIRAATAGIKINPHCVTSLNALANAYTKLGNWIKTEDICRQILSGNPNDTPSLNLLAQALRHQYRYKESRAVVAQILAQTPNDSFGHANAGHAALVAGDHLRANYHFRESLRLDPHSDFARSGLLASLYARIWVNRVNQRFFRFFRVSTTRRALITITCFLGVAISLFAIVDYLGRFNPELGVDLVGGFLVGGLFWLYFSLAVAFLGNALLCFDPIGRHALGTQEKIKAFMPVAAAVFTVIILIVGGYYKTALGLVGCLLLLYLMIQIPLWYDRYQQRRLDQSET